MSLPAKQHPAHVPQRPSSGVTEGLFQLVNKLSDQYNDQARETSALSGEIVSLRSEITALKTELQETRRESREATEESAKRETSTLDALNSMSTSIDRLVEISDASSQRQEKTESVIIEMMQNNIRIANEDADHKRKLRVEVWEIFKPLLVAVVSLLVLAITALGVYFGFR